MASVQLGKQVQLEGFPSRDISTLGSSPVSVRSQLTRQEWATRQSSPSSPKQPLTPPMVATPPEDGSIKIVESQISRGKTYCMLNTSTPKKTAFITSSCHMPSFAQICKDNKTRIPMQEHCRWSQSNHAMLGANSVHFCLREAQALPSPCSRTYPQKMKTQSHDKDDNMKKKHTW